MSTSPRIALFANHDSDQLEALRAIIAREGGTPLMFDIQLGGPRQPRVTIGAELLSWDGTDFATVDAVHIRCTAPNTLPMPPALQNVVSNAERHVQFLREQLYQATTQSFFEALHERGTLVINRLTQGYLEHDTKAQLAEQLRALGFDTPVTLTTNDAERTQAFLDRFGEVIVKPQIGIGSARLIEPQDVARFDELLVCPVLMQERVRGDTIRVHVVGETVVLALRIITDDEVDSRTQTRGFEYRELALEEQAAVVGATRHLGLHYAAWDVIVTPSGRCVLLDCNPGPYIMWIGPQHVDTVLTALARYLLTWSRTRSLQAARDAVEPWVPA